MGRWAVNIKLPTATIFDSVWTKYFLFVDIVPKKNVSTVYGVQFYASLIMCIVVIGYYDLKIEHNMIN